MSGILIRADGDRGAEYGMGHVYRSIAYARLFRSLGYCVSFCTREIEPGFSRIAAAGFNIERLPMSPNADDYARILDKLKPDIAIIDTLGISPECLQARNRVGTFTLTLDDISELAGQADLIVNGIVWASRWLPDPHGRAKVYQGIQYLQLRPEFCQAASMDREISGTIGRILLSTGGADGRHFTGGFMHAVAALPFPCDADVIIGPGNKDFEELNRLALSLECNSHRFSLHSSPDNMAVLYRSTDLAIVTGGTVMFESCACGTPAVVVSSYEHQIKQADFLASKGAIQHFGYASDTPDARHICNMVLALTERAPRQAMTAAARGLVDGRGINRFVDVILQELHHRA